VETLPSGPQRDNTVMNIARNWIRTDPTKAKAWVQGIALPDQMKAQLLR